jgi:hypothetical protein
MTLHLSPILSQNLLQISYKYHLNIYPQVFSKDTPHFCDSAEKPEVEFLVVCVKSPVVVSHGI